LRGKDGLAVRGPDRRPLASSPDGRPVTQSMLPGPLSPINCGKLKVNRNAGTLDDPGHVAIEELSYLHPVFGEEISLWIS